MRHSGPDVLVVRPAHPAEWPRAAALCVAAYEAAGQLDPGSTYHRVLADVPGRALDSLVLVAVRDGEIVGTVTICSPGSTSREIGGPDEVEFRFLAVDPSAWRSGVGEALVAAVEEHARAEGARALAICVRDTNTAAARLYERLGFVREPSRDWMPLPDVRLLALLRPVG
jgi:ribosomal protein S18 acetylase RimI-like enzyme